MDDMAVQGFELGSGSNGCELNAWGLAVWALLALCPRSSLSPTARYELANGDCLTFFMRLCHWVLATLAQ